MMNNVCVCLCTLHSVPVCLSVCVCICTVMSVTSFHRNSTVTDKVYMYMYTVFVCVL